MGAVGGLLGISGGAGGTGFATPQQANIIEAADKTQAKDLYGSNQAALAQQQALLNAIQQQNGLQNQSAVYNQLQNIANGTGPNPAQAMLNQATGANVANQAALMAGQRGSNANAGLLARQAAMQGAGIQQNAAGQSATMQAQQAMNALQGMGQMANTQAGQQIGATGAVTGAQQAEQSNILNALAQANNAKVGMQSNVNQGNASMANTQMGGLQGLVGGALGAVGAASMFSDKRLKTDIKEGNASEFLDNLNDYNYKYKGDNKEHLGIMAQDLEKSRAGKDLVQDTPAGKVVNFGEAGPQILASLADLNKRLRNMEGTKHMADGGEVDMNVQAPSLSISGPRSSFGQFISAPPPAMADLSAQGSPEAPANNKDRVEKSMSSAFEAVKEAKKPKEATGEVGTDMGGGMKMMAGMAKGGPVPAMVSPGEKYLSPRDVEKVKQGANPMEVGEKIPGKPKVSGAKNSYKNDTVPKTLEEGGIVLPRSVTQSKNPHWAAHKFVLDVMNNKNKSKGKK